MAWAEGLVGGKRTYEAQLLQHWRDAAGDHAQVLATHQHVGGAHEHGEGAQCVLRPQLVVPMVEVVVVEPGQMLLPAAVQGLIAAAVHQLYPLHAPRVCQHAGKSSKRYLKRAALQNGRVLDII